MSNTAKSVFVFAIYLFLLGITLLVTPNVLLTLFAYPTTEEVWIRVVGMLLVLCQPDLDGTFVLLTWENLCVRIRIPLGWTSIP